MIGVIIQARTGSTRFPEKIIKKLYKDYSVLEYLLKNLKIVKKIDKIVVATTNLNKDKAIVEMCKNAGVDCFVGDEADVQKRYIEAANYFKITEIIRIPSDNPFIIPKLIDDMIDKWRTCEVDYLSNVIFESYPTGMHVEIFAKDALVRSRMILDRPECREHVTPGIYNSPKHFKISSYKSSINYTNYRLTIDYKEDLEFSRKLARAICDKIPETIEELMCIIDDEPDLYRINCKYTKSQSIKL